MATNPFVLNMPAPATAPAAGGAQNPFTGAPDLMSVIRTMLAQGGGAGAFGPDFLRRLMRGYALRNARNAGRRTQTSIGLAGLDPTQSRYAKLFGDIGSANETAGALNQADLQGAQGYQDLLRSLLGSERSGEAQLRLARESKPQSDPWGAVGGLVGQLGVPVIGGLFENAAKKK